MSVQKQRVGALLLSKQQVSQFYRTSQVSCLVSPGLSDAVEESADVALSLLRAIKFIVGLDFVVTFLHLILFVFFSTSLQNTLQN